MSENEIKPVDGAIPAREFDGQLWIPADVAIELRSNDRATIDLLREDLAEIRSQRDRAELLVEARGTCIARLTAELEVARYDAKVNVSVLAAQHKIIDRLTAERDDALAAADSKAGWEWKKRAERAEAERDAAVADAERFIAYHNITGEARRPILNLCIEELAREVSIDEWRAAIDAARSEGGI